MADPTKTPCARRNPLTRSGLTQTGRHRAELERDHFLPDERDLSDLVLFGQRFARHMKYYGADNKVHADWTAFFGGNATANLAALAKLPVDGFRTFQLDLERWLKAEDHRDPALLKPHFRLAFYLPVTLLKVAAEFHARLPGDDPFRGSTAEFAARRLGDPLRRLASFYLGAVAGPAPNKSLFDDGPLAMTDYNTGAGPAELVRLPGQVTAALTGLPSFAEIPVAAPLLGGIDPGGWPALVAATAPDPSPYVDALGNPHQLYEQVYDALTYNLLTGAIEQLYQALERLRRDAATRLTASLEDFAGHQPHYGLWLAFLRLFAHAQGTINEFTGRHLDYYFTEVLGLGRRAPEPAKAHLLFQLAKGREAELLPRDTLFSAGKDATGVPIAYTLESDIVVNTGKVAELRGIRVDTQGTGATATQTVRAAPVVRSADGLGATLPPDTPAWPAFGPASAPFARLGFAVSDRKLFLREGTRTITLQTDLSRLPDLDKAPSWTVRLTGEKGWFDLSGPGRVETRILPRHRLRREIPRGRRDHDRRRFHATRDPITLQLRIFLTPEDPPVVPLDPKLHDGAHPAGLPALEVALDFNDPASAKAFPAIRDLRIGDLKLKTQATGLKQVTLTAGGANADPSKPFAPFGPQPRAGAHLVIGSAEIFSKPIASWRLNLDWQTPYNRTDFFWNHAESAYNSTQEVLSGGQWTGSRDTVTLHLGDTGATINMVNAAAIDGRAPQTTANPAFGPAAVNGFTRLSLPTDFGHETYQRENTRALIALAGEKSWLRPAGVNSTGPRIRPRKGRIQVGATSVKGHLPCEPYDPMITRIEAAYETPTAPAEQVRHLHPFGTSPAEPNRLLPKIDYQGALLIGVWAFKPPARLTLLVQVADGSGDPLLQPPPLGFHYLAGGDWKAFDPQNVDDKTGNFATSAVLGLSVPADATDRNTRMPDGLHWFRITAPRDPQALNRVISIDAQAARVSFQDTGNDPDFLRTPLAPGSIAKPVTPIPAIKKIAQPYSGFGGRPPEAHDAFATRVSERLRHKDRAVTMFDYEALVLEAFPGLYRAKCLGTTELIRGADNRIAADNEVKPGAVTVVTVPWTHGRNASDPLRPYTDQATLAAVDRFLRARVSPFVRLEVQNPKFEEVRVEFTIRFLPGIGDTAFYIGALKQALTGYLTPWASEGGGEIAFGGKLWKSSVIDFVEEQPHVDYVTDFRLYHKPDSERPDSAWAPVDVEMIEATTARSILVSHRDHIIHEVGPNA